MDYRDKYIKYKKKYLNLENMLLSGGGLKINDLDIDKKKLTLLNYDVINNKLGAIRDTNLDNTNVILTSKITIVNTDLCQYELIDPINSYMHTKFNMNIIDKNILKISDNRPEKITKNQISFIEVSNDYKLFCIKFIVNNINYEFIIVCDLNNLLKDYYYINNDSNYMFILNIIDEIDNHKIEGLCQIRKSTTRRDPQTQKHLNEILFDITQINNYKETITDIIDLPSLFISKFNFQNSYDKLKTNENYCPESTILFKHIYNTYLTNKLISNYEFYKYLQDNFGNLLEHVLLNNIKLKKDNILNICNATDKRINILNNVMKRIDTIYNKGILIKNGSNHFIDIESLSPYSVIFDTGNSAITTISANLVKILRLKIRKGFEFHTIGVAGESAKITHNKYVNLELKFVPQNTNINIDKPFKIKAYIDEIPNSNRILLGQQLEALKLFFDNSYCIGYNYDKQSYNKRYIESNEKYDYCYNIFNNILEKITKKDDTLISDLYKLQKKNPDLKFDFIHDIYDTDIDKEEVLFNLIKEINKLIPSFKNPFDLFSSRSRDNKIFIEKLKNITN